MTMQQTILELGSDLGLRYRYFTKESMAHPAKLHLGLLAWIAARYTAPGDTIADPMAGIGSTAYAALLQRNVILREIEPRWLAFAHENAATIIHDAGMFAGAIDIGQGDARQPWGFQADHIVFSPPYGCAFSQSPTAKGMMGQKMRRAGEGWSTRWKEVVERNDFGSTGAFTAFYGSHPAQIGHLRADAYWQAMADIYTQARAALRGNGHMILVIKDHIRRSVRVCVADQTVALCETLGFRLVERHARRVYPLSLWQRRRKEKGDPIVEDEDVLVFTTAQQETP
jgi:tRNA G10  N-methylase Trm11